MDSLKREEAEGEGGGAGEGTGEGGGRGESEERSNNRGSRRGKGGKPTATQRQRKPNLRHAVLGREIVFLFADEAALPFP